MVFMDNKINTFINNDIVVAAWKMVKSITAKSDKGIFHFHFHHHHHNKQRHRHRQCVNKISNYWTVKCKKAISNSISISSQKVLILLTTYVILSALQLLVSESSAQSLNRTKNATGKESTASYEEFIFEHQVTRQDAIDALQKLNQSFFDGPSGSTCRSITCTENVMKYCLGPQFINDHCWCEQGHANEGLPFIPHICYVGEKQYQASVGSCFFYEEVKECCCAPSLAKRWKHISAGPVNSAYPPAAVLVLAIFTKFGIHVLLNHLQ